MVIFLYPVPRRVVVVFVTPGEALPDWSFPPAAVAVDGGDVTATPPLGGVAADTVTFPLVGNGGSGLVMGLSLIHI